MTASRIEDAQQHLTEHVMALPGVVGTAIGECGGEPCLQVLVARLTASLREAIPQEFEGFRVDVRETGEIHALDSVDDSLDE